MIHIMLMILKIIGIILLSFICVFLLVLLIPFFYVGDLKYDNELKGYLKARWIFSAIYCKIYLEDSAVRYIFRVLGIPIKRGDLTKDEEEEEIDSLFHDLEDDADIFLEENVIDISGEEQSSDSGNVSGEQEKTYKNPEEHFSTENRQSEDNYTKFYTKSFFGRLCDKIKGLYKDAKDSKKVYAKVKRKCRNYKKVIKSKKAKYVFYYTKDILLKIYNHMKPDKVEANVIFGFEEPDMTGKALAVIAMACGTININPEKFSIEPDFTQKRLEGTLFFKGRFVVGYLLIYVIKIYFKKEVHDIIENFKRA